MPRGRKSKIETTPEVEEAEVVPEEPKELKLQVGLNHVEEEKVLKSKLPKGCLNRGVFYKGGKKFVCLEMS